MKGGFRLVDIHSWWERTGAEGLDGTLEGGPNRSHEGSRGNEAITTW
jgi:hypothetical protein